MTPTLGPCPCQGCGTLLFYDGLWWRERSANGHLIAERHRCYTDKLIDYDPARTAVVPMTPARGDELPPLHVITERWKANRYG